MQFIPDEGGRNEFDIHFNTSDIIAVRLVKIKRDRRAVFSLVQKCLGAKTGEER